MNEKIHHREAPPIDKLLNTLNQRDAYYQLELMNQEEERVSLMETNNLDKLVNTKRNEKDDIVDYSNVLPNFNRYKFLVEHILDEIAVYKTVPVSQQYDVKKICLTGLYAIKGDITMHEFEKIINDIDELDDNSKYTIYKFKSIINECPMEVKRMMEHYVK